MKGLQKVPVYVASGNNVKLQAVRDIEPLSGLELDVISEPVELQSLNNTEILQLLSTVATYLTAKDLIDLRDLLNVVKTIRDEPEGDETRLCMLLRLAAMIRTVVDKAPHNAVFIAAESGMDANSLVTHVGIRYTVHSYTGVSLPIPLAQWIVDEVHAHDNRITTGEVVHKRYPQLSAAGWHPYAESLVRGDNPPIATGITRGKQITDTLLPGILQIKLFF